MNGVSRESGYPFVGREDAFQAFKDVLKAPEQRVLFYRGDGGIGKTKLLEEIIRRYKDCSDLMVAPKIIDMAITQYHRISGVREEIIELLGGKLFTAYKEKQKRFLQERDKLEEERVVESALRCLREAADEQFIEDCKKACPKRTAVFLFDTFERVQQEDVGYYILHDLPQALPNFVFVIAGRKPCPIHDLVKTFELGGLSRKDAQDFFASRRQDYNKDYNEELWNKLKGHPLKLDLALFWASQGAVQLKDLTKLSTEIDPQKGCSELDLALVEPLKTLGCVPEVIPKDVYGEERERLEAAAFRIILLMAYYNRRFNSRFLQSTYTEAPYVASPEEAQELLKRLPKLFFIKERPNKDLQLHDEVERLILNCMKGVLAAQTVGGPWEEARKSLAEKAVKVYDALIEEKEKERKKTLEGEKKEDIEREIQELRAEQFSYSILINPAKSYKDFLAQFDHNLRAGRYGVCELYLNAIEQYLNLYDDSQKAEIKQRRFLFALARHDFDRAQELIETKEQEALLLFSLYNDTWVTDSILAKNYLLKALRICEEENLSLNRNWWLINVPYVLMHSCEERGALPLAPLAFAQQRLGLTSRMLNQFDEAIAWYERCRETAKKMGREGLRLYTETLNSQGYVHALMGDYDKGDVLVSNALRLRTKQWEKTEDLKEKREWRAAIGRSYSTRGEIARFKGDFRTANSFYNDAINVFKELNDPEWQAIVLHERAENARRIALKHRKHREKKLEDYWLKLAEDHLQESKALYEYWNLSRERSRMLRRLGRVVRDKERLDEAESLFKEGLQLAERTKAVEEQLECLIALAGLAVQKRVWTDMEDYLARVESLRSKVYHNQVFEGVAHVVRGDAFYTQGKWDEALEEYITGFIKLGEFGGYGHVHLANQLDRLIFQLDSLPDIETKHKWCLRFVTAWERAGLSEKLPELVWLCNNYKDSLVFLEEG